MRSLWNVGLIVVVIVVGAVSALYFLDRPVIPAAAPSVEVGRTDLEAANMEPLPPSASGDYLVSWTCNLRLDKDSAFADLCWAITRRADVDPQKDYYALHVGGTFGGPDVRWMAIEAQPFDTAFLPGTDGLPKGDQAGCHSLPLTQTAQGGAAPGQQLCGRVIAGPGDLEGSWRVSWACAPCFLMGDFDREIDLEFSVIVANGTIPNWTILADLGR